MALTNREIILNEMILNGISLDKIVDTYAGWNRNGYIINSKNKETEQTNNKMYLIKASFFSKDQVTKIDNQNKTVS